MLKSYHVDKAVISCKGFDLESGITDSDELHANNKITMLGAAGKKILAVDKSKFDKTAFTAIGALDDTQPLSRTRTGPEMAAGIRGSRDRMRLSQIEDKNNE